MRLALIGCSIFSREIGYAISKSKNVIHSFWLEQGLHNTPQLLQQVIQDSIHKVEAINAKRNAKPYDAIILGYGLCSNGIIGLTSSQIPLIIPRCDDCMALFLGSQQKYLELFNSSGGIYWYSKPWMENGTMPSKEHYASLYETYLEEYEDEDTAQYLIEQETSFISQYGNLCFIKSNLYDDAAEVERAKVIAQEFDWAYMQVDSNLGFITDLVDGNWDDRFLVCQPSQKVVAEYTGLKITAQ